MVSYLSQLGKLSFSQSQLIQLADDLSRIINIMDSVKDVNISYDPLADNKNIYLNDLRPDLSSLSLPSDSILQNALHSDNCFVVPKVIE